MMVKVAFFDAAGTLFETRDPVGASYARIAQRHGVAATAEQVNAAFRRVFHNAEGLAFGQGHSPDELRRLERNWWREIVAKTFAGLGTFSDFDAYFEELFSFFADPSNWRADPEAAPMLDALKRRGFALGLISNFDYRLYGIMRGLDLARFFDSITISSEAGFAKPSPRLFEAALDKYGVKPEEAIHVGDSEHLDVAGASAAGIAAILIDHNLAERISRSGRDVRISTLAAVPEVIAELPFA
jgi:putative hydrolase of the HAD superfamily